MNVTPAELEVATHQELVRNTLVRTPVITQDRAKQLTKLRLAGKWLPFARCGRGEVHPTDMKILAGQGFVRIRRDRDEVIAVNRHGEDWTEEDSKRTIYEYL